MENFSSDMIDIQAIGKFSLLIEKEKGSVSIYQRNLIGTYELLNFQNLSGQASRRGLEIHFPRYLFQHPGDRLDFQGVLLALLKQVPLDTDIPTLMQEWFYFSERSIGCVGVLKDWLIRTVAAILHDGGDVLSKEKLSEQALQVGQCERMAIDAIEGEQKLSYMASRREQLWRLLQMETAEMGFSGAATSEGKNSETKTKAEKTASKATKTTSKKRSSSVNSEVSASDEKEGETKTLKEGTTSKATKTTRKRRSEKAKSEVSTSGEKDALIETPVEEATSKQTKTTSKKRSSSSKSKVSTSSEKEGETKTPAQDATSKTTKTTSKKRSSSVKSQIPTQEIETKEETTSPKKQTTKKRQTRQKTQDTADKISDETKKIANDAYGEVVDESIEPMEIEPTAKKKKRTVGRA